MGHYLPRGVQLALAIYGIYFSHLIEYLDFCKNCSFVVRLLLLDNLWALFFYAFFLNFRTDSLI